MVLETRYLRRDLCSGVLWENLEVESIHEILVRKLNLPLTKVSQRLEAVGLPPDVAAHLDAPPGLPSFRLVRVTYTFDEPVTHVEYYFRGDRYAFEDVFHPQAENREGG